MVSEVSCRATDLHFPRLNVGIMGWRNVRENPASNGVNQPGYGAYNNSNRVLIERRRWKRRIRPITSFPCESLRDRENCNWSCPLLSCKQWEPCIGPKCVTPKGITPKVLSEQCISEHCFWSNYFRSYNFLTALETCIFRSTAFRSCAFLIPPAHWYCHVKSNFAGYCLQSYRTWRCS